MHDLGNEPQTANGVAEVYAAQVGSETPPPDACETVRQDGRRRSAIRHGLRIAKGNPSWRNIEDDALALRTALRQSVTEAHTELTLLAEALIQSATRHERRAALAERWLRINGDNLELADRLALLAAISAATDSRDKAIRALGLDAAPQSADPWKTLDALQTKAPA
jgi:hypothetical protein